jgi:hypothetical protein
LLTAVPTVSKPIVYVEVQTRDYFITPLWV